MGLAGLNLICKEGWISSGGSREESFVHLPDSKDQ